MPRIAIAGFQHETNSHGIGRAGLEEFAMADSWPRLLGGAEVLSETLGMNLPIAGFAAAALTGGAELCPILWCAAEPSGPVTDAAFEIIAGRIVEGLRNAGRIDAIYLDLHGAMITDSDPDGEGRLLALVRDLVGPHMPIAVSLDMHANVSAQMMDLADVLCIYKTYPHLDMAATGARCWDRLGPLLFGRRHAKAFRPPPYLIPLSAQDTGAEPAKGLYAALPDRLEAHVEMAFGFTAGNTPDAGPSIIAYAETQEEADHLADDALARLVSARGAFQTDLLCPEKAVSRALATPPGKPVVLADVQDNPGAGASSDTTGLLRALLAAEVPATLLGLMHDPALAAQAHAAGKGAVIDGAMGGRSGLADDRPFTGRFQVETLSDGRVTYTGAMYGGGVATMGPSCVLRVLDTKADIVVVVTSIRNQCLDLAQFTHFRLDPTAARIVVVKSTAHFRADFEPIAASVIPVAAPGLFPCELSAIQNNLKHGHSCRDWCAQAR
jgi:microcystin degradation protein MlrC